MSRMFDRLLLSDDITPERKAQIEKAVCIINVDECARYFFATIGDDGDKQCFVNTAPPFAEPFWIEYRVPRALTTLAAFSWGALIEPTDHGADANPRWTLRALFFKEPEKGSIIAGGVVDLPVSPDGAGAGWHAERIV